MAKKKAKPSQRDPVATEPGEIVVIKVALDARKSIWRRIAIHSNQTLDDLHEAIFEAFDRYDEHLYSFYFPRAGAKGYARLRDAVEITCPYMCEEPNSLMGAPARNAAKTTIRSLKLKPQQEFLYLFDFGDSWLHKLTVEQVDAAAKPVEYPCVVESRGNAPPQYPDDEDDDSGDDD